MTTPTPVDERFNLYDLLDLGVMREVCEQYANTFDLGMVILNHESEELISICPDNKFCTAVKEGGLKKKCGETHKRLAIHPLEGQQVLQMKISCGLRYALFPLIYQLDSLGRVLVGPYRDSESTTDDILRMQEQDAAKPVNAEMIQQVPDFSQKRLKVTVSLLEKIVNSFIFINAKRLITTRLHLDAIYGSREEIFNQVELQRTGTEEDKEEIEKLRNMF
jgi:ligand-binding sensor protein